MHKDLSVNVIAWMGTQLFTVRIMDQFSGKVDYKIEFESDRIKVTNALGWSRNHNGPNNEKSGWSPAFDWWTESWANATVLNAAYECRVTFHELGHSMHARLGGSLLFTAKILRESWAEFIEHSFILAYYPAQGNDSGKQREVRTDWNRGYTPLFIDLMDTENQLVTQGTGRSGGRLHFLATTGIPG